MKNINVQQNPGRGAKVVCPRPKTIPFQQSRIMSADGCFEQRVIKLRSRFILGQVL